MLDGNHANLALAWIGILLGCLSGAAQGLFFHGQSWLGGYGSWRRRMLRLGHISFFGIAFLNLGFAVTVTLVGEADASVWAARLLIAGAIGMPAICYLSAFREGFRHWFVLPVFCLTAAVLLVLRGFFYKCVSC